MLPACPIGHTVIWFWYFHDKKRSPFFHRTKWTSLCNESESKNSARPQQFQATRRKLRCVHGGACVEATKIDLFGCSIQSQTYGNRSLESYSLISFFEVANHPLNCRGIFLPVYSSRAKKRCNCYLVSGLTHIFHLPSILGMVSYRSTCFGLWLSMLAKASVVLWVTPTTWVADNLENMGVSGQPWGLNLPKWEDIEMAISASSALKQQEYVHPCCQAVRLAFVTWRRRLPGPPHQRWCPDLIWIWRGVHSEHWFRFQKLSFELSRSHGHYSYKMLQMLKRVGLNWILNH